MKLKVISTGSVGNAYILSNGVESLLIECGVHIKDIKSALKYDLSTLSGCIVTHEHMDHSKSVNDLTLLGANVYATKGTFDAIKTNVLMPYRRHVIKSKQTFSVGSFQIMPFDVQHDAAEPVGFIIYHPECGKTLFITDTNYSKYVFPGLNNIIVEANFCPKIIKQKFGPYSEMEFLRNRILKSHMSIDTCIDLLKANDLSAVNNIVLIHLSDSNSNEIEFKQRVFNATQKNVSVASKGLEINFDKIPF